jgi:hypothetical protein
VPNAWVAYSGALPPSRDRGGKAAYDASEAADVTQEKKHSPKRQRFLALVNPIKISAGAHSGLRLGAVAIAGLAKACPACLDPGGVAPRWLPFCLAVSIFKSNTEARRMISSWFDRQAEIGIVEFGDFHQP